MDVRRYEPPTALYGEGDGTGHITRLFQQFRSRAHSGASLYCEIGYDQGPRLRDLAISMLPQARVRIEQDFAHLDRYLIVHLT